jgi:hypothetical protein
MHTAPSVAVRQSYSLALIQNFGGNTFKDDREEKTSVTRWLIRQDTD